MGNLLNKWFHLSEKKTNVRTELIAAITTFMSMSYILAVNPSILADAGMDRGSVFMATALAAAGGSFLMGIMANLPIGLAPGMGLNAFFTYSVVLGMGVSWQFALTAVLVEGILFALLSFFDVRENIFNSIPHSLWFGISGGIGLFIILIGLLNSNMIIKNSSTGLARFSFNSGTPFKSVGITVLLTFIGIIFLAVLMVRKVKGAILISILVTWALGMFCEAAGWYVPDPNLGMYSLFPQFTDGILTIPSMKPTMFQFDFLAVIQNFGTFLIVMFTFFFGDCFDTIGTLMGVAESSDLLDEDGKLPRLKWALLADAGDTIWGAFCGTPTSTAFIESKTGVEAGGRTGLTAIFVGLLFIASIVLSPLFLAIPSFATAPALIVVGIMMLKSFFQVDKNDFREFFPATVCLFTMPFAYSIAEGISIGIISYTVINACTGKAKKVHPILYVLTFLFVLRYRFL